MFNTVSWIITIRISDLEFIIDVNALTLPGSIREEVFGNGANQV